MAKKTQNVIIRDFKRKLAQAGEFYLDKQPAFLGNYAGAVEVPNKNGLVYARVQSGQVVEVLNNVAPNIHNWPVYIGRDKSQPHTLKVLETRWIYNIEKMPHYTVFHHTQHEYPAPDTVWVYRDQFMPLLILPNGGLTVKLYGDVIYIVGMVRPIRVADQIVDMSGDVPGGTGAQYWLLELDPTGTVQKKFGTVVSSRQILEVEGEIPDPTAGSIPLCAIILEQGQVDIRRDSERRDIVDLRLFASPSGDAHTHSFALDDLSDVDAPTPALDEILAWDGSNWVPVPPTSAAGVAEDLLPQVPAASDHFDLAAEAVDGNGMLFWNGTYQDPSSYTMDVDNLGLTLDFSPTTDNTTSLYFIHGTGAITTIDVTDPNAIHDNVAGEINGLTLKATPIAADRALIEDSEDSFNKKSAPWPVQQPGGLELINTTTVTAAGSITITGIDDTYDEYEIRFSCNVATDNTSLLIRMSTDGGSTWVGTNYKYSGNRQYSNGFSGNIASNSATQGQIGTEIGNASGEFISGRLLLQNFRSTARWKVIGVETFWATAADFTASFYGQVTQLGITATKANAIQMWSGGGNITMTARLYGVKK